MRLIKLTALLTLSFFTLAFANSALDELKTKAESGDVEAQYELGMKYFYGRGVDKNFFEAEKWFHEAAEQGHVYSQYELGKLYDPDGESEYVFEKRYRSYRYGEKKEHDLQSATYGDQRDTVVSYDSVRYKAHAEKWLLKAAHNGLPEAQTSLAWLYIRGFGNQGNYQDAIDWLEKAAQQNYVPAQYELGNNYLVPSKEIMNYVRAHFWFNIIIENNQEYVDRARYSLNSVTRNMTEEQIKEAKLLFEREKDKILNQNQK